MFKRFIKPIQKDYSYQDLINLIKQNIDIFDNLNLNVDKILKGYYIFKQKLYTTTYYIAHILNAFFNVNTSISNITQKEYPNILWGNKTVDHTKLTNYPEYIYTDVDTTSIWENEEFNAVYTKLYRKSLLSFSFTYKYDESQDKYYKSLHLDTSITTCNPLYNMAEEEYQIQRVDRGSVGLFFSIPIMPLRYNSNLSFEILNREDFTHYDYFLQYKTLNIYINNQNVSLPDNYLSKLLLQTYDFSSVQGPQIYKMSIDEIYNILNDGSPNHFPLSPNQYNLYYDDETANMVTHATTEYKFNRWGNTGRPYDLLFMDFELKPDVIDTSIIYYCHIWLSREKE